MDRSLIGGKCHFLPQTPQNKGVGVSTSIMYQSTHYYISVVYIATVEKTVPHTFVRLSPSGTTQIPGGGSVNMVCRSLRENNNVYSH